MRTQTIDWKDFIKGHEQVLPKCYVIDLSGLKGTTSKGTLVKVAGITFIVLVAMPDVSFAAAAAGTGIDAGADKIYRKLINIGKWVIIIKGGIDTIKTVADGDFQSAKKNFLGYGVTYAILWGLPWMMREIEKLFEEMGT